MKKLKKSIHEDFDDFIARHGLGEQATICFCLDVARCLVRERGENPYEHISHILVAMDQCDLEEEEAASSATIN